MANLIDYLDWRGDLSFEERPLNEVDSLIFCELSYIDMSDIVPGPESGEAITLGSLADSYVSLGRKQADLFHNNPEPLLIAAGKSPRFRELSLSRYVNHIDPEKQVQFSAYCVSLPGDKIYIAYRGTDNSVVGWREDFNFSFSEETEGQREAREYLEASATALSGDMYIGGHSKGGNLAVYAAAFSSPTLRRRMLQVFSHDGPGFMEKVTGSEAYQSLLPHVSLFLPETSVVGILLDNQGKRTIIKSDGTGVMQHDPMTWQVRGTAFEQVDSNSAASAFMDKTLHKWLTDLDPDLRETFVTTLFDAMDQSGAQTLNDLGPNSLSSILRTMFEAEPDRRNEIIFVLKKLSSAGHDVFWSEARAAMTQRLEQAMAKLRRPKEEEKALPARES